MKKYVTVVADCPWSFGDKLPGKSRGSERNYSVMSVDDICGLARGGFVDVGMGIKRKGPPDAIALCGKKFALADDCLLFLWRVSSQVEEAYRVCRAWGFVPKSEIVWVKTTGKLMRAPGFPTGDGNWPDETVRYYMPTLHFGMGRYVRGSHETCIIAARGKAASIVTSHSIRSVFYAKVRKHSQKPEKFFRLVEKLCPGPRLELFAREHREGWTCIGDEIGVAE